MTDIELNANTELNAKLAQLLSIVEAGFAHLNAEVAGLKQDVARLDGRMAAMEGELFAVKTQQAIMNARLEDQWRIIAALIPTQIAAVSRSTAA